jgi:uncharacterized protein DUF6920
MHGEIKLKRWIRFSADQVIQRGRGFIWRATAWAGGAPIVGSDRLIDGAGAMRWKLFGIVPVMVASGSDVTRSAAGRFGVELIWLPSALCSDEVSWSSDDRFHPRGHLAVHGEAVALTLTIDDDGAPKSAALPRWGNPGGTAFSYVDFGGVVEAEKTFGGYTIPSRLRVGYFVGTERFDSEGEFIRITIDEATYR